ncbi:hypothetical protein FO519_000451 [Halicephalobus sp. NKZ332]|nr:hypothetical protein FO519_000451 [Halicephalobus sp. NKZ332]
MDLYIIVRGSDNRSVKVAVRATGVVGKGTLRDAFQLEEDVAIGLFREDIALERRREGDEFIFVLDTEWKGAEFELKWGEARRSRPSTPFGQVPPVSAPASKSFVKWMFFLRDHMGKSTVICIHPRFFVTFRHGSHLQLKAGDSLMIYKAEQEVEEQVGINVCVVKIDEALDFILLKSEVNVVEREPKSPNCSLWLGLAMSNSLSYLPGTIHSVRDYYSTFEGNANLMGPFVLGTSQSSGGDSAISEAAIFSPKNIISPALRFKEAYLVELEKERKEKKVVSPPRKKHCDEVEFEGIGRGSGCLFD